MAAGELSTDQARYVSAVAAGTGLDRTVVTAWVGAESGWKVTKPGGNYLNVGPGQLFSSTDQAAARVVQLVTADPRYAGIRAAVPAGPLAQAKAIEASPWDAGHYGGGRLTQLVTQLAGLPTSPSSDAVQVGVKVPGWVPFIGGDQVPTSPTEAVGGVAGVITKTVGDLIGPITDALFGAAVGVVLSAGAIGLITLGLNRLTGSTVRERVGEVQKIAGTGAQLAALA